MQFEVHPETTQPAVQRKLVNSETSQPAVSHKSPVWNLTTSCANQAEVHCENSQPKSILKPHSQLCHTSWSPPWHLTASCVTQAPVHSETLQTAVAHKLKSILKPYSQLWHTSWSPFWNLTACMSHKPKSVLKPQSQVCHITYSILEPQSQSHTGSQNHITVYILPTSHMILEPNRWQSKGYNSNCI